MERLHWFDVTGPALDVRGLHDILELRCRVFIAEQQSPYLDVDGRDLDAGTRHLGCRLGSPDGPLAGYLRLLAPVDGGAARIGRVIVSADLRGRRLGEQLMERAVAACATDWPGAAIDLSAQTHLQDFYGRFGFVATGVEYVEDGIPHADMTRPAD